MSRPTIVAANWKMNGNFALVEQMASELKKLSLDENNRVIICPSFVYLSAFNQQKIAQQLNDNIYLGCQNISEHDQGAFTGEVSADMLNECGVQYVIIGHSERRSIFKESSTLIAHKVAQALNAGLTPILCIGESEHERETEQTEIVLAAQLQPVIDVIGIEKFGEIVVAYEPVWAIGTGKTASPELAQQTHQFIRQFLASNDSDIAARVPLLYGGSVNASNSKTLFSQPDIDGGLIGGASLKADEFLAICSAT